MGNSCVHPPVDVCIDNHKQTVDWATYNAHKYELFSANCEQPEDLVVDSPWTDGTWACNDTTVEQTGTHTVTPYVKVDGVWVPGTPVVDAYAPHPDAQCQRDQALLRSRRVGNARLGLATTPQPGRRRT